MSKSIAGAKNTGQLAERYVAISKLSHRPEAILEIELAVAGAIIIASAHLPISTWLTHSPVSSTKKLLNTDFLDSVERVRGVIKSSALGVQTTLTSAPFFMNKRIRDAAL
tara:strand:- start:6316 stop:6645 length:330 start_codon:yes stop_codon:yes gene_type:complete